MYTPDTLISAHKHSSQHENEIVKSEICGCFYCMGVFEPGEILDWVDEDNPNGRTAICAKCGIDSVLGSASGYPVTDNAFLEAMHKCWFLRTRKL